MEILLGSLQNILAFAFVIGLLVIIHEWGHYIVSKKSGVPVEEFSIGFGKKVATLFRQGETEFTLRILPLGGFVRTVGMEPGDENPQGYNMQPVGTRAKIIVAGAAVNLIFGLLLMVVLGMTHGVPQEEEGTAAVHGVLAKSAAEQAGLQRGDQILSIGGKPVTSTLQATQEIAQYANKPMPLEILRDGKNVSITATPRAEKDGDKTVGRLGVQVGPNVHYQRVSAWRAAEVGVIRSYEMASSILTSLLSKSTWKNRELGGPVAIYGAAGETARMGWEYYAFFIAAFSINLGILNLLPLPVLDGGHLVLLGVEAIRRRRLPKETVLAYQSVGIAILFAFFMFIMWSDLDRLISRG